MSRASGKSASNGAERRRRAMTEIEKKVVQLSSVGDSYRYLIIYLL